MSYYNAGAEQITTVESEAQKRKSPVLIPPSPMPQSSVAANQGTSFTNSHGGALQKGNGMADANSASFYGSGYQTGNDANDDGENGCGSGMDVDNTASNLASFNAAGTTYADPSSSGYGNNNNFMDTYAAYLQQMQNNNSALLGSTGYAAGNGMGTYNMSNNLYAGNGYNNTYESYNAYGAPSAMSTATPAYGSLSTPVALANSLMSNGLASGTFGTSTPYGVDNSSYATGAAGMYGVDNSSYATGATGMYGVGNSSYATSASSGLSGGFNNNLNSSAMYNTAMQQTYGASLDNSGTSFSGGYGDSGGCAAPSYDGTNSFATYGAANSATTDTYETIGGTAAADQLATYDGDPGNNKSTSFSNNM